jgi:hypothetical protein
MERPYQIHAARPLTEKVLRRHLSQPLLRADHQGANEPSFAQSLTRLQHLRRHLFRAEDWEELSWLIKEGTYFEEKRQRKHPLFKFGPRRQLQEKVQHFHGRAAVKAAALASAMEPPLRRLLIRLEASPPPPGQARRFPGIVSVSSIPPVSGLPRPSRVRTSSSRWRRSCAPSSI